jgi:hypothetical protein
VTAREPRARHWLPWLLTLLLAAVALGSSWCPVTSVTAPDAHGAERVVRTLARAWADGDLEGLGALLDAKAEHRDLASGEIVRGREECLQFFRVTYGTDSPSDPRRVDVSSFRLLAPRVAIASLALRDADGRPTRSGWPPFSVSLLVHDARGWRVAATRAGANDGALDRESAGP